MPPTSWPVGPVPPLVRMDIAQQGSTVPPAPAEAPWNGTGLESRLSASAFHRRDAGKGIDLIRGTGRLAGPGVVEVGGVRHTARHVVVATGSDPVVPPIPGLRELAGVWTNREVTG